MGLGHITLDKGPSPSREKVMKHGMTNIVLFVKCTSCLQVWWKGRARVIQAITTPSSNHTHADMH